MSGSPSFFAHGQIVALVNAARGETLRQNGNQFRFPLLQPQTGDLEGQAVGEFIDCQPRQPVGLAEDDAAGIGKAQRLPRVPRRLDPADKKRAVDRLCLVPRQNADGQPGVRIEKPARGKSAAGCPARLRRIRPRRYRPPSPAHCHRSVSAPSERRFPRRAAGRPSDIPYAFKPPAHSAHRR